MPVKRVPGKHLAGKLTGSSARFIRFFNTMKRVHFAASIIALLVVVDMERALQAMQFLSVKTHFRYN